MFETP